MLDFIASDQGMAILGIAAWFVAVFAPPIVQPIVEAILARWLSKRRANGIDINSVVAMPKAFSGPHGSTIHAVSGVPTLRQLTFGMRLSAEERGLAQALYDIGLEQFCHYVNNRDGVIAEARQQMDCFRARISQSEILSAKDIGISLATAEGDELRITRARYDALEPSVKAYAQCVRREYEAEQSIARDLQNDVPRTDYTAVRSRIASGDVLLESIASALPVPWQEIMSIKDKIQFITPVVKPPKREFVNLVMSTDKGVLRDKRAERDGKWVTSKKLNVLVPYQEPVPMYHYRHHNRPPVCVGKVMTVDRNHSSEWDTEFWRQGGYRDQVYLSNKYGTHPEQLRKDYRRRQAQRARWTLVGVLVAVNIMLFAMRFL